ncbi:MAG: hypothetical protein R3236_11825, partial [Phycisphaeraceae bacterium]|nr:hypothetical protein [Phycisphaeraceae bacterium]
GMVDQKGTLSGGSAVDMVHDGQASEGLFTYSCEVEASETGFHGLAVRIIPGHKHLASSFVPGLITWEGA